MSSIIQSLQTSQLLWHASDTAVNSNNLHATGYPLLNQKLGGGWPDKGIVELQSEQIGIGEIRLLLPALAALKSEQVRHQSLFLWITPPGRLNGQALHMAGLPLENTLAAIDVSDEQAFWIAERSLRSGCCAAVILWCNELSPTQAKRLQLAAKEGQSLGLVIRPPSDVEQSLPVSVRMSVSPHEQGLTMNIGKRLGGYPLAPFALDMSNLWPELTRVPPPPIAAKANGQKPMLKAVK